MSLWSVDVESDGPCPGKHSMISFGMVRVDDNLDVAMGGRLKPISDIWIPEALAVSGFSREAVLEFDDPATVMQRAADFIAANNVGDRPIFISDNNGYDWMFMHYYFHVYLGYNPFGWSSRRIGDFYCGLRAKFTASGRDWHKMRKTHHSHDPVDDAKGNAEALIAMCTKWQVALPGVTIEIPLTKLKTK